MTTTFTEPSKTTERSVAERRREQAQAGKAFAHPLRIAIYEHLTELAEADRTARFTRTGKPRKKAPPEWQGSSPNEIAKAFGEPLTNVSYHVRMLHDLGVIELSDTEPRRGALEHYYKPVATISVAVAARNGSG